MADLLKRIKGDTYYIDGHVKTGVYIYDRKNCVLVDTGNDDQSGRKILRELEAEGLGVGAIINTHFHADHCGGNGFITKRTAAEVMATAIEAAIITNPYLEPFYLYSAHPPKELQNKHLMASPSKVDRIIEPGTILFGDKSLQVVDLKGHSPGQVGIVTPDGVMMTADAFFSSKIVQKYRLIYFTNIGQTIETLKRLGDTGYEWYLPCHGECTGDISDDISANLDAINATVDLLKWKLINPMTREEVLEYICDQYGIELNPSQYYLNQSCVSAYLSYMTDEGMLKAVIEDNRIKWVTV